uniref:Uncharacterized protein n=1 Tax=Candidatus Methanogaster sp. ANME-2c ERB4 TaxID=2759911 RepID=A0A7G9YKR4_9EURY|nr:hypothetical protein CJINKJJD_00031 [Methanosarcinales archaeon ANME-2c ERB4]
MKEVASQIASSAILPLGVILCGSVRTGASTAGRAQYVHRQHDGCDCDAFDPSPLAESRVRYVRESELPIENGVEKWYLLWGLHFSVQSDQIDLPEDWHVIDGGTYSGSALEIEFYDPYQIAFEVFGEMLTQPCSFSSR